MRGEIVSPRQDRQFTFCVFIQQIQELKKDTIPLRKLGSVLILVEILGRGASPVRRNRPAAVHKEIATLRRSRLVSHREGTVLKRVSVRHLM
ncbi:hypothetical protein [Mesorhizobium sp. Z1-4]|uniref:hypothetical protein n=1 Tax=Mesorhizobium sp. Z1-4 TaxID=2448478 RepID=UPI000FDCB0E8|nr:hypothetical protein [Mesorhizobium sp. Z1-4]